MTDQATKPLPRYLCHKEVQALKIDRLHRNGLESTLLIPADPNYQPIQVPISFLRKHDPQVPGYFLVYKDGYQSWSPVEAFESGYSRVV